MDDLAFSIRLVKQVGAHLVSRFQAAELETHLKEDLSLVTQADLEANTIITQALMSHFPNDHIISEETQPDISNAPYDAATPMWVIDPLDGTTNFSLGLHYWGVSLARLQNSLPQMAVLYYPLLDELYTAKRGQGAYLNQQSFTNQVDQYHKISFFICCSRTFQKYQVKIPYKTRILGCASYTFCAVARGSAIIGVEATPKIWDLAAAWLVVEEAGANIDGLENGPIFPLRQQKIEPNLEWPTIAANSQKRLVWAKQHIQRKKTDLDEWLRPGSS